jgi:hypothetical protein
LTDPDTARNKPVQILAQYCRDHCILYLNSDYPDGCPKCRETKPYLDAPLSK